jgi:hypothetical protein
MDVEILGNLIPSITNDPNQEILVVTSDGTEFNLKLLFLEGQQGWFYELSYFPQGGTSFSIGLTRLTQGNVLFNYRNQLPFGLLCLPSDVKDEGDPYFIDDFVPIDSSNLLSSRLQLYSLDKEQLMVLNGGV